MRKKFTMLFAALLACVGVAKAATNDVIDVATGYYTLQANNSNKFANYNAEAARIVPFDMGRFPTSVYLFTKGENGYYTIQTSDKKFVTYKATSNGDQIAIVAEADANDTNKWWVIREGNQATLTTIVPLQEGIGNTTPGLNYAANYNGANGALGLWHCSDDGSQWLMKPAAFMTVGAAKIKCNNSYVAYTDGGEYLTKTGNADEACGFTITAGEDGKYTIQIGDKYVINKDGGVKVADGEAVTEDNKWWVIAPNVTDQKSTGNQVDIFPFQNNIGRTTNAWNFAFSLNNVANSAIGYWNASDGGSKCEIEWNTISFTYVYKYNGEEKYRETHERYVGDLYPAPAVHHFGTTAEALVGTISADDADKTFDIALSVNLPFEAAADNKSISKWYYINIHTNPSNTGFLQYTEENTYIACELRGQVAADNKDAYTWAFVGNVFDGFKLVNKKAGTNMAVNSDGSSAPVLGNYATGVNWQMIASRTNTAAQYFCFDYPNNGDCLNAPTSGQLSFWWDNDNGSTMWVTERDDAAQIKAMVENAKGTLAALGEGETVGYVTAASKTTLSNAIATAEAAINSWEGIDAAEAGLQEALANLETIQPEEGEFYVLKNNHTGRYMNVESTAGLIATTAVGIGEVFQFVKDNGNLYLKNVERGTYVSTAKAHTWGQNSAAATAIADAKAVVVNNLGKDNQVSITPVGGGQLHHDTNSNNVVAWNGTVDSKSSWSIEAVDITELSHVVSISDVKWSTLVLGYDATIPVGVTAYAVTETGNNVATLTEITGTIPAYEAVLLNANEAGSYGFKYAESAEVVEGNMLKGTTVDSNFEEVAYVLANGTKGIGLYKAAYNVSTDTTNDGEEGVEDDTYEAFLNNAFKAYLPAPVGANAAMFAFGRGAEDDEESTGIESVELNGELVIYDLAGRRVEKMEKGIYIVNGKKVIK